MERVSAKYLHRLARVQEASELVLLGTISRVWNSNGSRKMVRKSRVLIFM